jgi:hypothetical protein
MRDHQITPAFPHFGEWVARAAKASAALKEPCTTIDCPERVPMLYTNMEILSIAYFTSAPVQAFLRAVDASFDIYRYRWGDAPLRAMVLGLFATADQVKECRCNLR